MSETKVVIKEKVRFSYAHVWEPVAMEEGQTPKYSVSIIIPKSAKKTLAKIEAAIKAAEQAGKNSKFDGKIPAKYKNPTLRDGDEERPDDEAYQDSFFINASSTKKPEIVDANLDPILDKDEFYSGCYGQVSLNFYAYNKGGNKGIAAGLNNLRKLEDGDRLGGDFSSAEDDFGDDGDDLM